MPSLDEFEALWSALRLPTTPARGSKTGAGPRVVYDELRTRYAEPHRKFHNFTHIDFCLGLLNASLALATEPDILAAAIWFHDAVYDTHASDNEEQSARLADKLLPLPLAQKETVHRLILDTRHFVPPETADGRLLADIDLAGIGGTSTAFAEGCAQIREEYGWVPAATYKTKRGQFLQSLLDRPDIYHTAPFHQQYEAPARRNLREELDRLAKMK